MATPRIPDDLLQPLGELTPGMFTQLDSAQLFVLLQGFLDQGYARATAHVPPVSAPNLDEAATAWAYAQAYLNVWRRLSLAPATVHVDGEVSRTYLSSQIETWEKLYTQWLSAFDSFLVSSADVRSVQTVVANVPTRTVF